ncbi:hypothetical protein PtB15_15B245 [Puccinia triticina]|nr:hypothetical protein PtB15_15B245 [Puccinia triticina]
MVSVSSSIASSIVVRRVVSIALVALRVALVLLLGGGAPTGSSMGVMVVLVDPEVWTM